MLRSFINGFILNLQFFSTIPLRKVEVPITETNIKRAVQLFPVLGLLQGSILFALLYVLSEWSFFSPLAIAFIIWLTIIVITGGIHLDGFIDTSDAFFSYRDQKKRIEILSDPRVGAFALISTIVLLSARFLFIYETVQMIHSATFVLILLIPFFGKLFMGTVLVTARPVKQSGIGELFHRSSDRTVFFYYTVYILLILTLIAFLFIDTIWITTIMLLVTLLAFWIAYKKVHDWFGGITGDVVGGTTEGVETILWMTVWLYHYYAMGLH